MATEQKREEVEQQTTQLPFLNWKEKVEEQYRKTREHAETYPYVWASYIVVYSGLALWTTYRSIKLRRTEDRVQGLQARLRKLVEAEESANSATPSIDKAMTILDLGVEVSKIFKMREDSGKWVGPNCGFFPLF